MQHTLIAVFDNRTDAQAAKDELSTAGFSGADIRQGGSSSASMAGGSGAASAGGSDTADEGFGAGIRHFFADLFGGDDDSQGHSGRYAAAVERGQHVLTLVTMSEQEVEQAADIVERHGPVDIDEQSGGQFLSASQSMSTGANMSAQTGSQGGMQGGAQGGAMTGSQQRAQGAAEGTVLPVIEEELRVGKREVQRGGVRIFQRIVETPVNETVNLREEHVSVERRPVNQPVAAADLANFQEKSIELHETAEEAVVEKSARVVEEVVIGKQVTQTAQQIADTVRRTEVDVEQLPASGASTSAGTASTAGVTGATTGMAGTDDNAYFRKHYDANYGTSGRSYDDYLPAYNYGSTMGASANYRGKQWNDVEPSLRQDWESRNPGSAWDSMKAAIRHGWDKITG